MFLVRLSLCHWETKLLSLNTRLSISDETWRSECLDTRLSPPILPYGTKRETKTILIHKYSPLHSLTSKHLKSYTVVVSLMHGALRLLRGSNTHVQTRCNRFISSMDLHLLLWRRLVRVGKKNVLLLIIVNYLLFKKGKHKTGLLR